MPEGVDLLTGTSITGEIVVFIERKQAHMGGIITVEELVAKSRAAQKEIAEYTQEQTDAIVRMFAKTVYDNAEALAALAVEETKMGVYEDKVAKNRGKSRIIWNHLKDKKSVGILSIDKNEGIIEVAKPMGVVGAVTPCTNPIVTPMCNAMFAVKGRNSIIIAPHPRAKRCAIKVAELYWHELGLMGAPRDIFLVIEEPDVDASARLMKEADVVIATGGMGMVKSAYSSGKPSFGVGAGNVQGLIDRGIDYRAAAKRMVASRIFDNGIICSGTQTMIAPKDDFNKVIEAFTSEGAYYTDREDEIGALREAVFPNGAMNKELVGQSVNKLAEAAGIKLPEGTKAIIVKVETSGSGEMFSREKMCPLMSAYVYDTWEEAVEIARRNLLCEGAGHSVDLQSDDRGHIEYAGLNLPVSRVLVNQVCATMNGGAFANSLSPTTTLGCGSWGNNSISENLSYFHLFNRSRIAFTKNSWTQPSDDEIWNW